MSLPRNFTPQITGFVSDYCEMVRQEQSAIREYFSSHPEKADDLLQESYDKRYSPSTFIQEHEGGYRVGWYELGYQNTQQFTSLADAVTDYLLLCYGVGRYQNVK